MSTVTLPVGLPPGTDPDSAYVKSVKPAQATPAISFISWTVPSGEVWLPIAILALLGTSAAAGNRRPTLYYSNPDGNDLFAQSSSTFYPANTPNELAGTLNNVVNPSNAVSADGDYQFSLPWLPLIPGSLVKLQNSTGSDVGDRWEGTNLLTVTTWDWGSGGVQPSGGPTTEQLGPFMFVPGPAAVAA